jgi:hypothetical protein
MNRFTKSKRLLFKFLSLITISLMFYSSISEARLRMFSRANCFPPGGANIGNESISWDPTRTHHHLSVVSAHILRGTIRHRASSGWIYTWWNNSASDRDPVGQALWFVVGGHFRWTPTEGAFVDAATQARSCNFPQV